MKIVQSTWVRYHHFDLARELNKMGHLKHIFTSLPPWKVKKESIEQDIPLELISANFHAEALRRLGQKLPFYTKQMDAKLAIYQTNQYSRWVAKNMPECDAYIAISGSGLHGGKVVKNRGGGYIMDRGSTHIRHADKVLREEHARWNLPYTPINRWIMANEEAETEEANLITVPSHFVRQTFVDQGVPLSKLRVVPYGVSLSEFYPIESNDDDVFRLIFVGNFSLRKGVPYLLEAFKNFKHPKKELLVFGNVSDEVKPIIAKYSSENIIFGGIIPRSEIKKYLSSAKALVLPSIEEGLALVQAQAMACGCPVIATPNTGSETLFTHEREGLIVSVRDELSLTNAFNRLADEPGLQKLLSLASLQKVKEFNGWETYANGMLKVAIESKNVQNITKV